MLSESWQRAAADTARKDASDIFYAARKAEYEARGIKWYVNRKGCRYYQLSPEDEEYNHKQSQTRAKVKHVFLVVKHLWRYQKVRYKGLLKNSTQVFSLFALANLYLVRNDLLTARG